MSNVSKNKRRDHMRLGDVQKGNKNWWTDNTMSYNWSDKVEEKRFCKEWFDAIDQRFIHDSHLFAHNEQPFDRVIPLDKLEGKNVLEVGCGMGFHTELMVRAGAKVTAIDISPTSVHATSERLRIRGLRANVFECDAEALDVPDSTFDFVWSWGVIHHSSSTGRIVRNIARVLDQEGEFRSMVYNRDGIYARYVLAFRYLLKGGFFRKTYDELLNESTDCFLARFYPPEQYADLLNTFFENVSYEIIGQMADALPLPHRLRTLVEPFVSENWARKQQAQRGLFIFAKAKYQN